MEMEIMLPCLSPTASLLSYPKTMSLSAKQTPPIPGTHSEAQPLMLVGPIRFKQGYPFCHALSKIDLSKRVIVCTVDCERLELEYGRQGFPRGIISPSGLQSQDRTALEGIK